MERAQLEGTELERAQLEGTQLERTQLEGTQLEGAQLEGTELEGAQLERTQLEGAQLERTQLEGAQLEGAQLERTELERAQLERTELERAQLERTELERAQLEGRHLWPRLPRHHHQVVVGGQVPQGDQHLGPRAQLLGPLVGQHAVLVQDSPEPLHLGNVYIALLLKVRKVDAIAGQRQGVVNGVVVGLPVMRLVPL
ncbi:MAG: pentapeptide repeat-containing protein, partial [Chloroflexi bacterium]|nr:pentapeptide repeat-containing protein [Chloroflexota bacterium]